MSRLIYGMHEPCPADVLPPGQGWILHLIEVGDNPEPHPGRDFRQWSDQGYGTIARLQYSWGGGGTFPTPNKLDAYIERVRTCVQNSKGCCIWIIGNEPNVSQEWNQSGYKLWPDYVAPIYNRCRQEIHVLPGHESDEVLLCPIGPWNVEIGAGWIDYFTQLVDLCDGVDGFALHTYSRGASPASITSEDKMDAPYSAYYNGFRTYRDWLEAIPIEYETRPVYITETNQNQTWTDANSGWVRAAYREIDDWNQQEKQTIRALCLYRWPRYDQYYIEDKRGVIEDFRQAQEFGYTWETESPPTRVLEVCATLMVDGRIDGTFVGTLEEL